MDYEFLTPLGGLLSLQLLVFQVCGLKSRDLRSSITKPSSFRDVTVQFESSAFVRSHHIAWAQKDFFRTVTSASKKFLPVCRAELFELISKDPAPLLPATEAESVTSGPVNPEPEITEPPVAPTDVELTQQSEAVEATTIQSELLETAPEVAPQDTTPTKDLNTILQLLETQGTAQTSDLDSLVGAIVNFLNEGNEVPPNLTIELPSSPGNPVELMLSSSGAGDQESVAWVLLYMAKCDVLLL